MIEVLAKDQFIDAMQDEEMTLRLCQSCPSTLRQVLETSLELESFELASRHRPRVAREAVLEDNEPEESQSEQKAMDQLVELARRAMRDPQQEQNADRSAVSNPIWAKLFLQVVPSWELSSSQVRRA